MSLVIRPGNSGDTSFVIQSWLKSFRPVYAEVNNPCYYAAFHPRIEELLLSTTVNVVESDGVLAAYAVYGRGRLFYAYTRFAFRKLGMCSALLEHIGPVASAGASQKKWQRCWRQKHGVVLYPWYL